MGADGADGAVDQPPHAIDAVRQQRGTDLPFAVVHLQAGKAIGKGLYGVDIKESNGRLYVIEVNDNPSIESGEDDCYPRVFEQIVSHLFAM